MPISDASIDSPDATAGPTEPKVIAPLPWSTVITVCAGLAGAWLAAGSTGLLGDPLRKALMWIALGIIICAHRSPGRRSIVTWAALLVAIVVAVLMTASPLDVVNSLGVAVVLALAATLVL